MSENFQGIDPLLEIPRERLGQGTRIEVRVVGDAAAVTTDMARWMADDLRDRNARSEPTRWIVPVGPVDQFQILADICNRERISLRGAVIFNMAEYCDASGRLIQPDHPLSFVKFMNGRFYDLLDSELRPLPENRIFPDPADLDALPRRIEAVGGIDVCFGGIGINGHIAFNEPPEPSKRISADEFRRLPTRVLRLSRETRTINSVTVGGDISTIPPMAVTIGMREVLASREIRIYCNRPWQSGIVRRILHGPVTPAVPASFLQEHTNVAFTIADFVAEAPQIGLK
jgi:glucosamine-6-phosphate deaminase